MRISNTAVRNTLVRVTCVVIALGLALPTLASESPSINVDVRQDDLGIAAAVVGTMTTPAVLKEVCSNPTGAIIRHCDRGEFNKKMVSVTFDALGGKYNVLLVNAGQWVGGLNGVVFHGRVKFGSHELDVWGFDNGEFTRAGDGGWINWAMVGWFKRHGEGGKHVVYTSWNDSPTTSNDGAEELDDDDLGELSDLIGLEEEP